MPTLEDEPHSGFETELDTMLTELHSFGSLREAIVSEIKTKLETTTRHLKHQEILGKARELLANGDLDEAQKELERVDESASAEVSQEKLQV